MTDIIQYRICDYSSFSDVNQLNRLYRSIFNVEFNKDDSYWYKKRSDRSPIGILAYENNILIGHNGAIPLEIKINGQAEPCWMSYGSMISPAKRGQGLFTKMHIELLNHLKMNEESTAIIGFPNENSINIFLNDLSYRHIRDYSFVEIPAKPRNSSLFQAVDIDSVTIIDKKNTKNGVVHNKEYLEWRYSDSKYICMHNEKKELIIGTKYKNKLDVLYWSEGFSLDDLQAYSFFMREKNDLDMVTTWNTNSSLNSFHKYPREYHLCIFPLSEAYDDIDLTSSNWEVFSGDCELF